MRILTLLTLLFCCSIQCAFAQFNRLFTSDSELPNSLINDVEEGPDEMIWVATEDGLCRFDGSRFKTYRHESGNKNSLANNFVRTLCADDKGHLLIGSLSGVQVYRPATDDFSPVLTNPAIRVNEGNVNHISILHNGDFFVSGNKTFTIRVDERGDFLVLANPYTDQVQFTHRSIEDKEGNIWVVQENEDLYRLDTKGNLAPIRPNGQRLLFETLVCDPDGNIFAGGSGSGIYQYDKHKNDFELITQPNQNFAVRDFCIVPGTHQMYVGTDGDGAKVLDCQTGQITNFIYDDARIDAATQKVHSISISKNGEVWMALYQKGVFEMARNPLQFRYFGPKSVRYNCIGDRCVTSMLRLHDGTIWVATDNGGLYGINQMGQTLVHYPYTMQPNSVPHSFMSIFEDSRNRVWFGSYSQGGGIVDLKTGHCQYLPIAGQDGFSANVYSFVEDKHGTIWAATMGLGLLRYNEAAKEFRQVLTTNNECRWSCALEYDPEKDKIYVGSYNGLNTISINGDSLTTEQTFPDYIIYSITRFSGDKLALCTNQGLIVYDCETHIHRRYTTEEGLPNDNLYASLIDNEGNIWMSSNSGLSKLNINQSQVTNYTIRDGLQGNEFYKNAAMRDQDGTLWFGGTNGITWFKPLSIYQQTQQYVVRIVDCRSDQLTIHPDATGTYQLTDDSHAFTIELATRPIMLTSRVIFRYSMDGDRWQTLPPGLNRVSFSHMSSGLHEFRYQAVLDGVGSEVVTSKIDIAYPWYSTWWARTIWASILLALIGLSALLFWRRLQTRRRLREHHQHEAINEAKLQFFMNISHEFRTPMTLILTPLQKLISNDTDPQRQHSYHLIERNANRILTLINELMDLRKIDAAQMNILCHPVQIVPHVKDLCSTVSDMAEARKIQLSIESELSDQTSILLDTTCFEKILINLLSNALKYTPEGGEIEVAICEGSVSKQFPEGSIKIFVTDTGIGIPVQERAHIFERFYQVRNDISHAVGTGIGLNLVNSLVTLHHGTIQVEDNPKGQGTTFIVSLPQGESAYTKEEISTEPTEQKGMYQAPAPSSFVLQSMAEIAPAEPEPVESAAPSSRKHIAVVEDDEEIRRYIISELTPYYKVSGFPNGKQAYEAILTGNFHLILSDLMMPEMNGEELCQKIRGNVRLNHLPVILLTARTSDEDRLNSLDIGANAFLTKPFNVDVLKKTIQNLLKSHDSLRNSFSGNQVPADQVETPEVKSPDERLLERIVKVINDNLDNPSLTSEMIAKEVGLSRVHLYRKLKELTNQSARNYFRNIRLTKAAELLAQKKMAVSEIAYKVGFANPNNFATAFKELYGVSPTQYMEGHQPDPHPQLENDAEEPDDDNLNKD